MSQRTAPIYTQRTVSSPQNGQGLATNQKERTIGMARVLVKRVSLIARQDTGHQMNLGILDQGVEELGAGIQEGQK